jgi:hypothetical protein
MRIKILNNVFTFRPKFKVALNLGNSCVSSDQEHWKSIFWTAHHTQGTHALYMNVNKLQAWDFLGRMNWWDEMELRWSLEIQASSIRICNSKGWGSATGGSVSSLDVKHDKVYRLHLIQVAMCYTIIWLLFGFHSL